MADTILIPKDTPDWQNLLSEVQASVSDAENYVLATSQFTDRNGNTVQQGAKAWASDAQTSANNAATSESNAATSESNAADSASDAEKHAQSTSGFTDSNGTTFDDGAKGYAQDAKFRTIGQLLHGDPGNNYTKAEGQKAFVSKNLTNATVNDDGTLTIDANSSITFTIHREFNVQNPGSRLAIPKANWVVALQGNPDGRGGNVSFAFTQGAAVNDSSNVISIPPPNENPTGLIHTRFRPYKDGSDIIMEISNTTGSPENILYPLVTIRDPWNVQGALPPEIQTFPTWEPELLGGNSEEDISQQKHEEWRQERYFSINGSDASAGDRQNPLRNFDAVSPSLGERVGIIGEDPTTNGTIFRQNLIDAIAEGVQVLSVRRDPADDRVRISGLQQIADADWSQDGTYTNTYVTTFTSTDNLSDTQSNQVLYALEVNTTDEGPRAGGPSQRTFLKVVDSKTECDNNAGTCYVEDQSGNDNESGTQWKIWIHPSNNTAPSNSKFTYEVNDLVGPLPINLPKSLHLRGLTLVGPNTGLMAEGRHLVTDRVHWRGGTKHHTVYHSGVARRCIWSGRCQTGITHTFYENGAQFRSGKVINSLFLETQASGIYMHTSFSGSNFRYNEMVVRGTWFKNKFDQFSGNTRDTIGEAIDMQSVKDVTVENNYFTKYLICVRASGPRRLYVKENFAYGPYNEFLKVSSAENLVRAENNTSICTGGYFSTTGRNVGSFWDLKADLNDRLYIHNNLHVCFQPNMNDSVSLGTLDNSGSPWTITENFYNIWVNANRNGKSATMRRIDLQGGGNSPSGVTPPNYRANYNIYIRVNGVFN